MSFPQLYTTTSYTLLRSTLKIKELLQTAKQRGYQVAGITDRNVLSGVIEFYQACRASDIKPVIGLELDYQIEGTSDESSIILYAKNQMGYKNLIYLSSTKMTEDKSFELREHKEYLNGLVAVLPDQNEVKKYFGNQAECLSRFEKLRDLFDAGCFYLGLSGEAVNEGGSWLQFAGENRLPLLALQNVSYLDPEDGFGVKVLEHIASGQVLDDGLIRNAQELRGQNYLREAPALEEYFLKEGFGQAVENAESVAEACQFELPLHQKLLPHYPVPGDALPGDYLAELCREALAERVKNPDDTYKERLAYELKVIHEMGFDDYFLIVWDVMAFAHDQKIFLGAGRGSAAGSLVAYVLKITDVDPIQYGLFFERFLNPERRSMPDIDLDIPDNRREEMLAYVQKKYGTHHMAQIATFGTMAAKMALRDVSRALGLSQSEANKWSQAVPGVPKITLKEVMKESNRLTVLSSESPKYTLLLKTALQLEGLPRHVSTHAAGIVISDIDLIELVPLQRGSEEIFLTQFTMNDVEATGLLKVDFLGLRNLSIIDDTLKGIKRLYHEDINVKQVPFDDEKTLALFQKGETSGIFQFESAGIRNVLRRLEPNSIEDIAAVNALYRPGPMQNIDTFIRRKKGMEPITYPDDSLKEILSNTYGVIVYQEQVMQVASKMAGFSLGQADILRRAISKKKQDVLDEQRSLFIEGAERNGHSYKKADEIYKYIERFGNYGFNRSHAFAYSFIGFQMGYLKVHYPVPFYAALLHSVRHNPSKIKEYVNEARKNGIKILPPSISQSEYSFKILDDKTIQFGFNAIKGIRRDFIQDVLEERRANGSYHSFDSFLVRIRSKWLKKENLIPLIAVGCFDGDGPNRRILLDELEGKISNALYSAGSMDLLEIMELKEEEKPDFTLENKLQLEEDYLGVYLSGHPTEGFENIRRMKKIRPITDSVTGEKIAILYYIRDIREIMTKRGEKMAFLDGNDVSGEMSVTVFPKLYRKVRQSIKENGVCFIEGKVEESSYNHEMQLLAENLVLAEELEAQLKGEICYLKIKTENDKPNVLDDLQHILQLHSGMIPVIVFFEKDRRKIQLADEFRISGSSQVQQELKELLGNDCVVFKK